MGKNIIAPTTQIKAIILSKNTKKKGINKKSIKTTHKSKTVAIIMPQAAVVMAIVIPKIGKIQKRPIADKIAHIIMREIVNAIAFDKEESWLFMISLFLSLSM